MIIDYHIHPCYSVDAEGTIEEYCQRAIKLSINEICFTPHFEIDPERKEKDDKINFRGKIVPMRSDWIDYYFQEIDAVRKKFSNLSVRAGIEIGYDPIIESELKTFTRSYPFDFVLGAIHCLNHCAITNHKELDDFISVYSKKTPKRVAEEYFAILNQAVKSGLFDAIAHFDVYKKYLVKIIGGELLTVSEFFLDSILKTVASQNIGIELNTSGLRQNPNEIYPSATILSKAKELGVKIFTIGSDAHRLNQLGFGLKPGLALAKRLDLDLYRFEKRRPIPLG
uniref:Histidinol-phosphatase n=1 Tax=candidate division WOR-3 bacterium TaxID=2052148 RepID=A0A7C6EB75_UNCW3